VFNFRDIGGVQADGGVVRRGALLRSDALVDLAEDDHGELARAGIRTAIDLRERGERDRSTAALRAIRLHEIELIGGDPAALTMDLLGFNRWLLANRAERLGAVVKLLAQPGALPGVYFCSSGKDRTGLVTALILSLLGVEEEAIVRDYAVTAELMPEEYFAEAIERAIAGGLPEHLLDGYRTTGLGSPPEVMVGTLHELNDTYGGAERYLLAAGVTQDELDALRAVLVQPQPA
jgi:protein-tyrosine phosphatase